MASRPMQTFVTYKLISKPYIFRQMHTIWNPTTQSLNVYDNDLKACASYKAKSGECITEIYHAKDLGVTLSSNCNFKEHVNNVLSTANQLCGWVLRTFSTRKPLPMTTLLKTLIRSRLDYCCQLWSPSNKGDVQALEQLYVRSVEYSTSLTGSS